MESRTGNRNRNVSPPSLDDPIVSLNGVSTAFAANLEESLGLYTVDDLLRHYPRRYEDRTKFRLIAELKPGEETTIRGKVIAVDNVPTRNRMTITRVAINDSTGTASLIFFNQWFLKKQFEKLKGTQIIAFGRVSKGRDHLELTEVEWEPVAQTRDPLSAERIVPVYPASDGINQLRLRKAVYAALHSHIGTIQEHLPLPVRIRKGLLSAADAIREIHFPSDELSWRNAQRRIIFAEFLELQLVLAIRRRQAQKARGNVFTDVISPVAELEAILPFPLTDAQKRAINDIAADMHNDYPMHRLVQGDVGAGKTVVAIAGLLIAVRNGYQAALMAPTEILAEQHFFGVHRLLEQLGVKVTLLTGSLTPKQKQAIIDGIAIGEYQVIIGTHALIQEGVSFQRLGLAVVDEQHRFGVLQRAALKGKGTMPELLVMTATPIPRTLTLTVYGDLDVSIIDQLPPGRKPIKTHWKKNLERRQVYESLRSLIRDGRQAYVICSLIEENEKLQAKAATDLAVELQNLIFPEYKIGLLHGQMKPSEKEEVMLRFRDREINILVATTVIEVGVDVPNASVIIIEDADRFGLAQLHQLRGRVGRGSTQSYCLLIADPKTEEGIARINIMTSSTDGFKIAEEDLKLRGPGDFYGTRQSGMQTLPFLDVIRDVSALHEAREEAFNILEDDPQLVESDNQLLRLRVKERYHHMLGATSS